MALISYRQWRTANDKLRLDLYNRRFDLYSRVLALEGVLAGWTDNDREKEILAGFKRALDEARFLFPPESGVSASFQRFADASANITSYLLLVKMAKESGNFGKTDWPQLRIDAYNLSINARIVLDAAISPYLMFTNSSDRVTWLRGLQARRLLRERLESSAKRAAEGSERIRAEALKRGGQALF